MYWMNLPSPVGQLTIASDGQAICGLWLQGQKYYAATLEADSVQSPERPEFHQAADWLESYFAGRIPPALPRLSLKGTPFRRAVWRLLLEIPRGQTTTYGALAQRLRDVGISASAHAGGGAGGHKPISILSPCHRVVGTDGSPTGYAGGMAVKRCLLELEGVDIGKMHLPRTGTAL